MNDVDMFNFLMWRSYLRNVIKSILFLIYSMKIAVYWKFPKANVYLNGNSPEIINSNIWCYLVGTCISSNSRWLQHILEEVRKAFLSSITANDIKFSSSFQRG